MLTGIKQERNIQGITRTSSRLLIAPTDAASSSLVKYLALFIDSLLRVISETEFPATISRSMLELKLYNVQSVKLGYKEKNI